MDSVAILAKELPSSFWEHSFLALFQLRAVMQVAEILPKPTAEQHLWYLFEFVQISFNFIEFLDLTAVESYLPEVVMPRVEDPPISVR